MVLCLHSPGCVLLEIVASTCTCSVFFFSEMKGHYSPGSSCVFGINPPPGIRLLHKSGWRGSPSPNFSTLMLILKTLAERPREEESELRMAKPSCDCFLLELSDGLSKPVWMAIFSKNVKESKRRNKCSLHIFRCPFSDYLSVCFLNLFFYCYVCPHCPREHLGPLILIRHC